MRYEHHPVTWCYQGTHTNTDPEEILYVFITL